LGIKVYENNIEKAIRALKRQLQRDGVFKEVRMRSYYEKPSEKKKRKQRDARRKRIKALKYNKPD